MQQQNYAPKRLPLATLEDLDEFGSGKLQGLWRILIRIRIWVRFFGNHFLGRTAQQMAPVLENVWNIPFSKKPSRKNLTSKPWSLQSSVVSALTIMTWIKFQSFQCNCGSKLGPQQAVPW